MGKHPIFKCKEVRGSPLPPSTGMLLDSNCCAQTTIGSKLRLGQSVKLKITFRKVCSKACGGAQTINKRLLVGPRDEEVFEKRRIRWRH